MPLPEAPLPPESFPERAASDPRKARGLASYIGWFAACAFCLLAATRCAVNHDEEWISRRGWKTDSWEKVCAQVGAERAIVYGPYVSPRRIREDVGPLNMVFIPLYPSVDDSDYFVVFVNSFGVVVRTGVTTGEHIGALEGTGEIDRRR